MKPWEETWIVPNGDVWIDNDSDDEDESRIADTGGRGPAMAARAHLIAAAPELYRALEELTKRVLMEDPESEDLDVLSALAALKKARGET